MIIQNVDYDTMYDGIFDGKLRYIAEEIFNRRSQLGSDETEEIFKENVSLTKQYIRYLFFANPERLYNLLSFDAYQLFFKSNNNISPIVCDFGSTDRELVDMAARESDFENDYSVSGRLTKYHNDCFTGEIEKVKKYNFLGSFNIHYSSKVDGDISKSYFFTTEEINLSNINLSTHQMVEHPMNETGVKKDDNIIAPKLSVKANINGKLYEESIWLLPNQSLLYSISGGDLIRPIVQVEEQYINDTIESYINSGGSKDIKFLFPEIYQQDYFKEYDDVVRIRA